MYQAYKMKLVQTTVTGFKLFEAEHSFSFGMGNHIAGDRGQGKTALSEAIIWCLKGCDLTGNVKGVKKRLANPNTKEMKVVTTWEFHTPEGLLNKHSFCRISTARSMRLFLDDEKVSQNDFDAWFGETDTLLSIFLPGYIGGIGAARMNHVVLSMLPAQDISQVMNSLPAETQTRLNLDELSDPLQYLQSLKIELGEWNDYIQETEKTIEQLLLSNALRGSSAIIEDDERKMADIRQQIEMLEEEAGPTFPEHITLWEEESKVLRKRYDAEVESWGKLNKTPVNGGERERFKRKLELDQIANRCNAILEEGFSLRKDINKNRAQYEEEKAEFIARTEQELQRLQIDLQMIEAKIELKQKTGHSFKQFPLHQKNLDDAKIQREYLQVEVESVQQFMLRYAELQVIAANRELSSAEILFIPRRGKVGDYTFHYRLRYKEREYYLLSGADKNRVSFELADLVAMTLGMVIPVFIDNCESIKEVIGERTQFFVTSYLPQAELSHEIIVA
ncbi:hypothetical protein ACDZ28_00970 (plasmid) [Paenibacillus sp. RS8]|uniref:hypothetical protein n=1 Tax=Paenibacillus sp. RS8 TaxID=3242681 RepID=UPI0035C14998